MNHLALHLLELELNQHFRQHLDLASLLELVTAPNLQPAVAPIGIDPATFSLEIAAVP